MRKVLLIISYLLLILFVIGVGYIAIDLYIGEFGHSELSSNTEDWANFATYISGTVGVAAVVATLIAFVITLGQQQKLIESQDEMLNNSQDQLRLSEEQNNWLIGYDCYKNILPIHLEECSDDLKHSILEPLRLNGFCNDAEFFKFFTVESLFDDSEFSNHVDGSTLVGVECLEYIRRNYLDKRYGLALVASRCMSASDILRPLVMDELVENDALNSIYCVLAYRKGFDKKNVVKIEKSLGVTVDDFVKGSQAAQWWKIQGERVGGLSV